MNFVEKIAKIWNQPACEAKQSWWSEQCANRRTWWTVVSEIFALCGEVLWFYLYAVTTVAVILVSIYKVFRYKRRLNELSERIERRQLQIQQQNTNVIVQASRKPIVETTLTTHNGDVTTTAVNANENTQSGGNKCYVCESTTHQPRECPILAKMRALADKELKEHFNRDDNDDSGIYNEDQSEYDKLEPRKSVQRSKREIPESNRNKSTSWSRSASGRLMRTDEDEEAAETNSEERHVRFSAINKARESTQDYAMESDFVEYSPTRSFERTRQTLISTHSPISYPAPTKFNRNADVREWINEVELYMEVTGVRDGKKTIFWAYLDAETRRILESIRFDDDDERATRQLKNRLIELFGARQKGTLDLIREFSERKQRPGENVRIFCLELQSLCKRAFTDCLNHERMIIDQFIEGVGNKQLQLNLYSEKPTSVSQMLDIATRYEEAFFKQSEKSEKARSYYTKSASEVNEKPRQSSYENQVQSNRYYEPRTCFGCGTRGHVRSECPNERAAQTNYGQSSSGNTFSGQTQRSTNQPNISTANSATNINAQMGASQTNNGDTHGVHFANTNAKGG